MYTQPLVCPNSKCQATGGEWFSKVGYFKTKWNAQHNPRYLCLKCGMEFGSHSDRAIKGQKKPNLNAEVFKWVCSGVSINRIAESLGINRKTVMRKITWLAREASRFHHHAIESGELNTDFVQFDEVETFEHTRLKPISIAIAVQVSTRKIIDIKVATMKNQTKNASIANEKYGDRADTREDACRSVFRTVALVAKQNIKITTDTRPH